MDIIPCEDPLPDMPWVLETSEELQNAWEVARWHLEHRHELKTNFRHPDANPNVTSGIYPALFAM